MTRLFHHLAYALPLAIGGVSAQAQPAAVAPDCTAAAPLPAWLAGWSSPGTMKAAANEKAVRSSELMPGRAVTLALLQTPKVDYALRPDKPGGTVSYGGLLRFTVAEEGVWRVALGSGAWVDVVKDGKAAPSIAHGHGPACSGIRKMVDYRLTPGTYLLQVAANGTDTVGLMVARQP